MLSKGLSRNDIRKYIEGSKENTICNGNGLFSLLVYENISNCTFCKYYWENIYSSCIYYDRGDVVNRGCR